MPDYVGLPRHVPTFISFRFDRRGPTPRVTKHVITPKPCKEFSALGGKSNGTYSEACCNGLSLVSKNDGRKGFGQCKKTMSNKQMYFSGTLMS